MNETRSRERSQAFARRRRVDRAAADSPGHARYTASRYVNSSKGDALRWFRFTHTGQVHMCIARSTPQHNTCALPHVRVSEWLSSSKIDRCPRIGYFPIHMATFVSGELPLTLRAKVHTGVRTPKKPRLYMPALSFGASPHVA